VPGTPGSDAWIAQVEKENGQFGQACLKNTGPLLQYVDTDSAARDLDLLRAVLGDKKLNYLGYSYGTLLGANTMFTAIILPLYDQSNWKYLDQLFDDVRQGGTSIAFQLADSYNDRDSSGVYSSNETEAFQAINCLDYKTDSDPADMRRQAAELDAQAPLFGPVMSWGGTSCATWPFPGSRDRLAIHAAGSAPIVVVGTTDDPATPYVWAKNLAKELQNGHLVTRKGEGHTGYNKGNRCVDSAVDDFFVNDKVPTSDPHC
jgi:pimeloyl-ACP methyl ester carboxylesterase